MIDKNILTGLLETYDGFLTDATVSLLRHLDRSNALVESNTRVERKLVDFLKGKMFPVSVERITEYIKKMPAESIRDRVAENLREMHFILTEMMSFIGKDSPDQMVYLPLIRMMERANHPYRPLAIATLCCFDFAEAINNLTLHFSGFSCEMRWITLILLKKRWNEKFIPIFIKALDDEDPEVARVAILAMKRAEVVSAVAPIRQLLNSPSEAVVLNAVSALVELGASDVMPDLLRLYQDTQNQHIKATIVSAFGDLGDSETILFLSECLNEPDTRVRANAVMALKKKFEKHGELPAEVFARIVDLKNDPDHRVQADSIQALWSMGHTDNRKDIEKMLVAGSDLRRSAGAYLCGKLKLLHLIRQLELLTADSSWSVRKMAAISLLALGDSGKSILRNLMDFGDPNQQIVAAFAFAVSGDSDAIDKLIAQSYSGTEFAEMATGLLLGLSMPPA